MTNQEGLSTLGCTFIAIAAGGEADDIRQALRVAAYMPINLAKKHGTGAQIIKDILDERATAMLQAQFGQAMEIIRKDGE